MNSYKKLIVARMNPLSANVVANIFAESDAGELPRLLGVTHRNLFHFKGLYFHLFESEREIEPHLVRMREHPLFLDVNTKLARYISPYDPATWRGPSDAMAYEFYSWHSK
ncbi:TcmI family type II polyketide cyclase [Melittangium boletus]|uniref:Polyketide synthase n=1 Tax=Melittangium boletus DSM 14713 TaxID=1294270 RepID=A0A250IEB7_9BACT|nr:TcmI family type II polyketide cyclase [Melittangium boletus]ATB29583.1 polyketide synthase [Melittangium boletus DSM 14713]